MDRYVNHIVTIVFVIGIYVTTNGQNYLFDAQAINVENGLPHRSTYSIQQDHDGYIWVSVPGAISRYDGHNFKTYNSSFLNIDENRPIFLAADKDNNIWYCERTTADRHIRSGVLNTKKEIVSSIESFTKGLIASKDVIYLNQSIANNDVFITTRQGVIYKYDGNLTEIYRFEEPIDQLAICEEASDGGYWILYRRSAIKLNRQYRVDKTYVIPEEFGSVSRVLEDSPNLIIETQAFIYVAEKNYLEFENGKFVPYQIKNETTSRIQILQKNKEYIVYSANDTIKVRDQSGTNIFAYSKIKSSGATFKYQTAMVDRQNILWITSGNGLYKIIPKKNPFKILQKDQSIRGIYKKKDQLYVGSYTENVILDLKTGAKTKIVDNNNDAVTSFLIGKDSHLWLGTTTRYVYDYNDYNHNITTYSTVEIESMYVLFKNPITKRILVGSSKGLAFLDQENKSINFSTLSGLNSDVEIRFFYENEKGLWIVTNKGIFLMDIKTETILKHYSMENGLPNDNIYHLYEDSNNIFWLASKGGGLIEWNQKSNDFKQYTTEKGLSNDVIYNVQEDTYGNLWLPSNYGLMRFNKDTKKVRVYLPENGLAHEEFNTYANFQDKDGTLYLGGLNGITVFNPKDMIEDTKSIIPFKISQLKVLDEQHSDFTNVTKIFFNTNKVILKPTDRVLEIEVSLLDFENQNELQYSYQIEGYQNQWVYTKSNTLVFNNLPYGSYDINIKGKGLASGSNSEIIKIPVIVEKPFYLTWEFFTAIILTTFILIYSVYRWRVNQLKKDRARLEDEVKSRTLQIEKDKQVIETQAEALKELDKAKTRFFSNITHEFRTPLTLIIGPLEQLMDEQPPPVIFKRRMQGVMKNAKHILQLINQLLDLSKIEGGQMKLELVHGDIIGYTNDLVKRFQNMANQKEHRLAFIANKDSWHVQFDQSKWDKIVFNLLSNAIKFTPSGGSTQVSLVSEYIEQKAYIKLYVSDSGIGIKEAHLGQIFNRFYQVDETSRRTEEGTGIGLSLVKELVLLQGGNIKVMSTEGKGTTFEILLPVFEDQLDTALLKNYNEELLSIESTEKERLLIEKGLVTNESENLDILIVEDNVEMREYIIQCIKNPNYNITEAANGSEGLQKAQAIIPDLIISDVMMPKMDGFELTQAIRENVSTSHIPLVLLTAKSSLESKLKGLKRGADAYLTKPFSPLELQLNVQNLIEIRALYQKRYLNKEEFTSDETYEQENEFITKLKNYILENISEPNLNGDHIGKIFGLSRVHLYRKLKALTNQSITDFVKLVRLERAMELLKEGHMNVSEVSDVTGFSNISHFSSSFKKAFGKAPSQV